MATTGAGRVGRQAVDGRADRERSLRAERGAGRRTRRASRSVAPVTRRQPPPRPVEVDEDLLDGMSLVGQRGGDRGPGHDRDVVLGRRAAEQHDDRRSGGFAVGRLGGRAVTARPPSRSSRRRTRPRTRSSTPSRARISARTRSARRRTSAAVPFWSLTMKLACFSETTAPPIRVPLSPAASISRPAESPSGLRKTLPADGRPSGWWAWRQWRISSRRALIVSGSASVSRNVASMTTSRGAPSAAARRPP